MSYSPSSRRFKVGRILEKWWFKFFEAVAFILLLTKLLPEAWLKEAKETGWGLIGLLGISVLSLLLINYLLTLGYAKEIANREKRFSDLLSEIKDNNNIEISKLRDENIELEKKARYADVLPMLNAAFQELHSASRRNYEDITKYHEPFVIFCQNLEKVFTHLTGVECHVCIKMTLYPKGEIPAPHKIDKMRNSLQVKTYCRSSSPSSVRKKIDNDNSISHLINENTDFEHLFKPNQTCFFCSDLATLDEYKNSSFKPLRQGSFIYFEKGVPYEEKVRRWPLNYRSTIVAPIRPIIPEEKYEHNIIGLLCVDCSSPNVFNEEIDKHIMIGCADGIYNPFKKLFTVTKPSFIKQNQNDGKETSPNQQQTK